MTTKDILSNIYYGTIRNSIRKYKF